MIVKTAPDLSGSAQAHSSRGDVSAPALFERCNSLDQFETAHEFRSGLGPVACVEQSDFGGIIPPWVARGLIDRDEFALPGDGLVAIFRDRCGIDALRMSWSLVEPVTRIGRMEKFKGWVSLLCGANVAQNNRCVIVANRFFVEAEGQSGRGGTWVVPIISTPILLAGVCWRRGDKMECSILVQRSRGGIERFSRWMPIVINAGEEWDWINFRLASALVV